MFTLASNALTPLRIAGRPREDRSMGLAKKVAEVGAGKFAGLADPGPSALHVRLRRLLADAIVLARYAILAWSFLFVVLIVSLIDIVDFRPNEIARAALTYAGVVAAIVFAVGGVGLLISGGMLAVGRVKQLASRHYTPEPGDQHDLWDEWLDLPGTEGVPPRI